VAPNGLPLADFGARLGAFLIDYAICTCVTLVLAVPFILWWIWSIYDMAVNQQGPSPSFFFAVLGYALVLTVVSVGFTYAYFVEYQLRRGGQTIGKRALNIQVIAVTPGARLTRNQLVIRWAVQWVLGHFVNVFLLIDGLWQLWDKPLRQCLHDKAADTVVVRLG
jgi:uncharacterized RDD family membrane protein YckC